MGGVGAGCGHLLAAAVLLRPERPGGQRESTPRGSHATSLRHAHTEQDEFVYILQGRPTLHIDEGRTQLTPGLCAGFKAGTGNAHHLINETTEEVVYLEVGDRTPGDEGGYPDDDLKASLLEGRWKFVRKNGTPYCDTRTMTSGNDMASWYVIVHEHPSTVYTLSPRQNLELQL